MSKSKMGRPALYPTPEELQAAVDRYFDSCKGEPVFDETGAPVMLRPGVQKTIGKRPPTMAGLSLSLGFKDRRQFTYQKNRGAEFADVVALARLRVEMAVEERLFDAQGYSGAAFMLRTFFGWGKEDQANSPAAARVVIEVSTDGSDRQKNGTAYHDTSIEMLN